MTRGIYIPNGNEGECIDVFAVCEGSGKYRIFPEEGYTGKGVEFKAEGNIVEGEDLYLYDKMQKKKAV